MSYPPLEMTHELRLRRWARLFHVPATERDPLWHPVILEEMEQRDRDVDLIAEDAPTSGSRCDRAHSLQAAHMLQTAVSGSLRRTPTSATRAGV